MKLDDFFAHLEAALVAAPEFRAEAPTVIDVWVVDEPWVVRLTSDGVVACYPGEWHGGAAPVIRVATLVAWRGMIDAPATLDALVLAGAVTMDESADPGFWWPRWRAMLDMRFAWTAAHP